MQLFLALIQSSTAADITCDDVTSLLAIGLPVEAVVEAVADDTLTAEAAACVLAVPGLPEPVATWAREHSVDADPVLDPQPEPNPEPNPEPRAEPWKPNAHPYTDPVVRPPSIPLTGPCGLPYLMTELPTTGAAVGLSGFVGLGAGHFYSGNNKAGAAFAFAELWGVGVLAASPYAASPRNALVAGAAVFSVARMLDVATAPASAQWARTRHLESCGY